MSLSLLPSRDIRASECVCVCVCVCVSLCVCSLQCIVINTDRQVLTWDYSPGERLQAFPWHPSRSYQRTDYTDFEQAYPYQGMCVWFVCSCMTDDRQSLSLVPHRRLNGEKTSLPLTLLTMHVAKSLHKNGPIFNRPVSVRDCAIRIAMLCHSLAIAVSLFILRLTSLPYGLP